MIKEFPNFTNVNELPVDNGHETTENEGAIVPFRTSQSGEVGTSLYKAYETSLLERRGLDREIGALTRWLTNNADVNFNDMRPTLDNQIDLIARYADANDLPLRPLEEGELLELPVDRTASESALEIYDAEVLQFPNRHSYPPLRLVEEPVE